MTSLSRAQETALAAVRRWFDRREKPWFYLAGYAGTGKTTLARHLAEGVGRPLFAAFTGKAALCMHRAGCDGAQTIHSLIYQPTGRAKAHLRELEERRAKAEAEGRPTVDLDAEIAEERERCRRPAFTLNPASALVEADLLIVDECSMIGERMAVDLLSFGVPVLVLGDPAQLPPVGSAGYFTAREPDHTLTEIHRQARDNPIIDLATRIREGETPGFGRYGESEIIPLRSFDRQAVDPAASQVLVGLNATRRRANLFLRGRAVGEAASPVVAGDRLVCLRNDNKLGILNGGIWHVETAIDPPDAPFLSLDLSDDDDRERILLDVQAHREPFDGEKVSPWTAMDAQEFDYGYALTVHKAQGSQWPSVVVVDESGAFRGDRHRWLYTAVTRAAEKIQIVR